MHIQPSRLDAIACVVAILLIASVAARPVAASRGDGKRAACQNNQRQLLGGYHGWLNDHVDLMPWFVNQSEGGTRTPGLFRAGAVWLEMSVLSNYVAAPRILTCPADPTGNPAENWGGGLGGLLNGAHRANAVSYILATDGAPGLPHSPLIADRDFRTSPGIISCSRGFNNARFIISPQAGIDDVRWTNLLHSSAGHLGRYDGSVEAVPSSRLQRAFSEFGITDDAGTFHFLQPR